MVGTGAQLRFRGLGHNYDVGGTPSTVLSAVDLDLSPGARLAIVGPSGSGKSTMMKIMMGLVTPTNGVVQIEAADHSLPRRAVVFQDPTLLPWLTALENVVLPLELGAGSASNVERASRELDRVGLLPFANYLPAALSGGMQSRVALARALVVDPELLLLDEPFADLDEATSEDLVVTMSALVEESGATVVMITHSLIHAAYLADRVLVLSARAGGVYQDIRIEGPRPRYREFLDDRDFQTSVQRLRVALREAVHAG